MSGFASFHEWFRVANTDVWVCPGPPAPQGEPGATWSVECTRAGGEETGEAAKTLSYEVVGLETVTVGGEAVETLHVRIQGPGAGATRGSSLSEMWLLPGTNLPVRWVEQRDSVSDSRIGEVGVQRAVRGDADLPAPRRLSLRLPRGGDAPAAQRSGRPGGGRRAGGAEVQASSPACGGRR